MSSATLDASVSAPALMRRLSRVPGWPYLAAAGLVGATLLFRLALNPIIVTGYGFTLFYPAVILSAYWLGARPALMATTLSAAIVYTFLGPQPLTLHMSANTAVFLSIFVLSSLLLIHVLSSIRGRFTDLAASHARVEALAIGQAEIFRDHVQRTTDHLQLISAILQVRARDEQDAAAAQVLTNAASRTLSISRAHRSLGGGEPGKVRFDDFARRLIDASARRTGLPGPAVTLAAAGREVPVEQATALGLVVLETLSTFQAGDQPASVTIGLYDTGARRALRITASGVGQTPRDPVLMDAMTEQLNGRLTIRNGERASMVELSFPADLQAPPRWNPLGVPLH